jgi:uncharacterized protein (DUF58 family)
MAFRFLFEPLNLSGDRSRPPTGFRIPKQGRYWVLAVLVLLAMGWFKGINLLLLLAYLMLVVWGLNFFLAGQRLHRLHVRRHIDGPVFARTPFAVTIDIANPRKQAQYGFAVVDRGADHRESWFVVKLASQEETRFERDVTLPRRGRYAWRGVAVRSGYPFGLIERTVRLTPPQDVIVLPQLGRVHRGRLRRFLSCTAPLADRVHRTPPVPHAVQVDFYGLRPYRSGDSPRWIHWRTSARRGELMVREHESATNDNLVLVLDPWIGPVPNLDGDPTPWERDPGFALEQAVSLAASICWEWCRQKGDWIVLAVAGAAPLVLGGVTGREHALRMLECLAVQASETQIDAGLLAEQLLAERLPPGPALVVSTRGPDLADRLAARLRRPVAHLSAGKPHDFYEGPPTNAS